MSVPKLILGCLLFHPVYYNSFVEISFLLVLSTHLNYDINDFIFYFKKYALPHIRAFIAKLKLRKK